MSENEQVSRRNFVGGVAAALGYMALKPESLLYAQARTAAPAAGAAAGAAQQAAPTLAEQMALYDGYAKIANNENPYGAPPVVKQAIMDAWKYHNRYGYPDPDIIGTIARHHGVKNENVMIAAGSGEILDIVGSTFLDGANQLKVVAADPTYNSVLSHATAIRAAAFAVPLIMPDAKQNVPEMLRVTKKHYREVGFVYLCNPNNPTGRIVPKNEVKQLVEGLPDDMPILIDEAYHHFVESSDYATSVPYILEGRPVIIARTFSKIVALAGMRLGYAIAPAELIAKMKPYGTGTVNALVKYGGVAALTNPEAIKAQENTKKANGELRRKTVASIQKLGYESIPSDANFFMVHIKRPVQPVIEEFKKKGVLVGRPFPPMTEYLRVSVGTPDEMDRFVKGFAEIFTGPAPAASGGRGGAGGRK